MLRTQPPIGILTRDVLVSAGVIQARADAERKAWDALCRYKFWMFGYHAAQWVLLNRVAAEKESNPFRSLVLFARARRSA